MKSGSLIRQRWESLKGRRREERASQTRGCDGEPICKVIEKLGRVKTETGRKRQICEELENEGGTSD